MAPSIVWGIGIGLVIGLADSITVFLEAHAMAPELPISEVNLLLNIGLYSLIGFRVGRAMGLVRDAAEGGVLAGFVVALIDIGFLLLLKPTVGSLAVSSWIDAVAILAQNVAMGGVIGIVTGWFGSRDEESNSASRL
ncbi:MAG: hypothetical protein IT306_27085 [Chloroflexi bacterium]|nr:hypothetical protein [Chloroflexota bacterium]